MGVSITGGLAKGMIVKVPAGRTTRPTSAKVREAIWNSLQTRLPIASMLDLFAGSGAMGLEALSRGASQVTWVDADAKAIQDIKINQSEIERRAQRQNLEVGHSKAVRQDVAKFLAGPRGGYDLIFMDPPYELVAASGQGWLTAVERQLADDGLIVFECRRGIAVGDLCPKTLLVVKEKLYGDTMISFLERQLE